MLTGQYKVVGSYPKPHSHPHSADADERLEAMSDEELLERFLNQDQENAEAAFRAIVVRHGPMVLGVCRHVLTQHQDAEDAFQAAFLVLARKAGSIRDRRVLAGWLYEVAYRIAMRSRTSGVRRRAHERQGGEMTATVSTDNPGWFELKPVLHEEVNRLPEKYRMPVILSYLEGKTNEEVAKLLKCPVGTVKGRLSRARDLLRSRLTRRGLALSAALLVSALSSGTVIADVVPARLVDETVAGAMTITDRPGDDQGPVPIPPEIARLMELASTTLWEWSSRVGIVTILVLLIAGALGSMGLTPGLVFESQPGVSPFQSWPFAKPTAHPSPDAPRLSVPASSCAAAAAPAQPEAANP